MDVVHSTLMKKCTNKPSFCDKIRRLFLFFTPIGNPDQEAVTDLYNDFEQISCLLKNLDLFISVSNTTAHLAGALNVPTWLIKPKSNAIFHYWNQPNSICPWYPSIKLIDQNNNLIKNLKEDLVNFFI